MERCDALIVGAGPAGSTCARRLAAAGLDVVILDKARFPRDKPCAGWITPAALRALDVRPEEYARDRTLQPVDGFRVGMIDRGSVEIGYPQPVSYGIVRSELDTFLLRRSGARVETGCPVTRLRRSGAGWIVEERVRTPLLIGAGGHFCPVARHVNPLPTGAMPVLARVLEFRDERGRYPVRPGVPELYFCSDLLGYGWILRKGDRVNVGLGRRGGGRLQDHVNGFLSFARREGRLPEDLPRGWRGHAYFLRERPGRRIVDDGALLLGDAAGLAFPTSGEGILTAAESGALAAEVVVAAAGRYGRAVLALYEELLRERLPPAPPHRGPSAWRSGVAASLVSRAWFARHMVIDRWFLRGDVPGCQPSHFSGQLSTHPPESS